MKKLLSLLLLTVMLSTLLMSCGDDNQSWRRQIGDDGLIYWYNDDDTYTLIGVNGYRSGEISVNFFNGLPVVGISEAFRGNTDITSVFLGENVQTISSHSFYDCTSLKTVKGGHNLRIIGDYAFSGCSSLEELSFPTSLSYIGSYCFRDCINLRTLSLPDTVENVGMNAFEHCSTDLLTTCDGAVYVANQNNPYYFLYKAESPEITSVKVHDDAQMIINSAFADCTALSLVTLGSGLRTIDDFAFAGCLSLESIVLPSNLESVGSYAFQNCYALSSVVLNENLQSIGEYAFYFCTGLVTNHYLSERYLGTPSNPYFYLFSSADDTVTKVEPHPSTVIIGSTAFHSFKQLTSITIPSGVRVIDESAFCNCDSLKKVILPDSVERINTDAFLGCESLNSLSRRWADLYR